MKRVQPTTAVDDQWRIPDAMWEQIASLVPPETPHPNGGHPWQPARKMMDAIFFQLRTGCQWKAIPRTLGAGSTVHDRFQAWEQAGVFAAMWRAGWAAYDLAHGIEWEWQAMDGAMTKAPLGGKRHGSQPHGSGQTWYQT